MQTQDQFEIFLSAPPGLEPVLASEVALKGFKRPAATPGGVTIRGGWPEAWRANLWLRGAGRVLVRIDRFRADYLNYLYDRACRVPWGQFLRPDVPFRTEVTCHKSRIYHAGAAAERLSNAITHALGARHDPDAAPDASVAVMARIDHDTCTISLDTSGEPLHRRGYKTEVNQAPMRETLASLFLLQCGYDGSEPVFDPMCGSGTFVIEAASIAARLNPGRSRRFAFELLAGFDDAAWQRMRAVNSQRVPAVRFLGSDRDQAAVEHSRRNAARAGVDAWTDFRQATANQIEPPPGPPGLVIVNPPYGNRIGDAQRLPALYRALGAALKARFAGWRVGLVTSEPELAFATGLNFLPPGPPVPHGGLRVKLFQTAALE